MQKTENSKGERATENELVTEEKVENTPFTIIGVYNEKEKKRIYTLVMGKYKLTEDSEDHEEIKKTSQEFNWNRVMQVMACMINEFTNEKNKKK